MEYCQDQLSEELKEIRAELVEIKKLLTGSLRPFLTFEEAAKYLGISKNTLYSYTSRKLLPFCKVNGRKIYFKKEDLDVFTLGKKNRIMSGEEIDTIATEMATEKNNKYG